MGQYSVADAKNRLPSLLSAAERGEHIIITRYGKPIAEIRPISTGPRRVTAASIEWIEQQLADLPAPSQDSVAQFDALRREDDH